MPEWTVILKASVWDDFVSDTTPGPGCLNVVGISPRYHNHEDEISFVKAHAAKQLAIYFGAYIHDQSLLMEQTGATSRKELIEIVYNKDVAKTIFNKIEIGRDYQGDDYYAAEISLNLNSVPLLPELNFSSRGKPDWTLNPPRINGFITGLGISRPKKNIYESWNQADKRAMSEIASYLQTSLKTKSAGLQNSNEGGASISGSYSETAINIDSMIIISRWREPDHSAYYSLAIMKEE
ncbi:MAG: hypothetical protein B6241_13815 [Spirochaetaceae bacterium 4572_59]|nr:MAG: hypothetical protein B6241_13815 [Spirochaetaceae bacterium 4572_59]